MAIILNIKGLKITINIPKKNNLKLKKFGIKIKKKIKNTNITIIKKKIKKIFFLKKKKYNYSEYIKRYLNNKQKIIIKEKNENKKIIFIIISILKHCNKKFNYIIKKKNETIKLNNSTTLIIGGKNTNLWNSKYNILLIDNVKWVKNQKEKKFKNYIKNIKKIIKHPPKGSNLIYYKEKIIKKIIKSKKHQKKIEYQKNKINNTKILISRKILKNIGITNNEFYKSIKLF